MTQLRLNPALDVKRYQRQFAEQKYVQITNLFEPAVADHLERTIASLPFRLVFQNDAQQNIFFTPEEFAALPADQRKRLEDGMRTRAARSVGYTYFMFHMIEAALRGWAPEHPIHQLTIFLNSPPFLEFARSLIGERGLTKIDAHASLYRPGHYLTTHSDDDQKTHGRAAYTIGFSRDWRPDWGGLLMLIDDKSDVSRGLIPRFNTLTVFDGQMPHTVTCISPFTPNPRISVAGWFRDDPPVVG